MIGEVVTLNKQELDLCLRISQARNASNRSGGIRDAKIGGGSSLEVDMRGMCGELAFCKLFMVYPKTIFESGEKDVIKSSSKSTDDGDATMSDGRVVDVKTTNRSSGRLIAPRWKKPGNINLFALITGENDTFTFRGFMNERELLRPHRLRQMRRGAPESFVAEQDELRELDEVGLFTGDVDAMVNHFEQRTSNVIPMFD
jgi:hypothetical protein